MRIAPPATTPFAAPSTDSLDSGNSAIALCAVAASSRKRPRGRRRSKNVRSVDRRDHRLVGDLRSHLAGLFSEKKDRAVQLVSCR